LKLVVGVIRPEKLEAVKQALGEAKVFRLTVSDVQGVAGPDEAMGEASTSAAAAYAAGGAASHAASQATSAPRPARRVKLEIAVNESFVEPTVRAIARAAQAGDHGDGKVLVLPLEECVRIRTGERGPEAI
jgi:nitrogen regulatory protein P-II 1